MISLKEAPVQSLRACQAQLLGQQRQNLHLVDGHSLLLPGVSILNESLVTSKVARAANIHGCFDAGKATLNACCEHVINGVLVQEPTHLPKVLRGLAACRAAGEASKSSTRQVTLHTPGRPLRTWLAADQGLQ